jgi:hypothetical protein
MNDKKPTLSVKEPKAEQQPDNNGMTRPRNPLVNALPTEGYVLEIDGKLTHNPKSEANAAGKIRLRQMS